jgi:hypothetical protein
MIWEYFWFRITNNRDFSNVNFGFELGKKGTTALVQENYANLSVSFT